jgi:hypothetical protein
MDKTGGYNYSSIRNHENKYKNTTRQHICFQRFLQMSAYSLSSFFVRRLEDGSQLALAHVTVNVKAGINLKVTRFIDDHEICQIFTSFFDDYTTEITVRVEKIFCGTFLITS